MHIHHVAFGVVLVMVSGLTLVTLSVDGQEPEFTAAATFFGIGAALVLDEFALILHLSDVYWAEDGRTSVDAVFAAVAVAGLLIMGLHPLMFFLPIWDGADSMALRAALRGALALTLPLAWWCCSRARCGRVCSACSSWCCWSSARSGCRVRTPRGPGGATPPSRPRCGGRCNGSARCAGRSCRPSCGCSARSPARRACPTSAPSTPSWTATSTRRRRRRAPKPS